MLNPKHILITGASSGIGAALTMLYAAHGVRLSLHGRDRERLTHIAARAVQKGATVLTMMSDVTEQDILAAWIRKCDDIEPIDLIIANAGISAGTGRNGESEDQSRAIFATNLKGVLNTIHPVMPLMIRRRHGQIAMMSSLASFRGFPGAPAYCASKAAVRVYGEALRSELRAYNVEVNVICPGFIKTPMTDVNHFPMPFKMPAEQAARIIQKGLTANRARIAFPWQMYALVRFMAALPQSWLDKFMSRLPKKGG